MSAFEKAKKSVQVKGVSKIDVFRKKIQESIKS